MIGTQYKTVKLISFDIVCRQFFLYVACLIARVTAMHLHADVIEIVCGPSEALKTREEGDDLVSKIVSGTFLHHNVLLLVARSGGTREANNIREDTYHIYTLRSATV